MNLMKQTNRQTVVRGIVRHVVDRGVSHVGIGVGHIDSNPDRTDFHIDVVEGSADLFYKWFETAAGYGIVGYGDNASFSVIGTSPWPIQEGELIELTFNQYLTARIDHLESYALNQIYYQRNQALKWIDSLS